MNSVSLIGRLTKDPELKTGNGLSFVRFSLAVDRGKRNGEDLGADFIPCVCFGKTAETIEKYVKKGQQIGVSGRLRTGSYEKDGKKVYTMDVLLDRFEFLGSRAASEYEDPRASLGPFDILGTELDSKGKSYENPFDSFILSEDDIPF